MDKKACQNNTGKPFPAYAIIKNNLKSLALTFKNSNFAELIFAEIGTVLQKRAIRIVLWCNGSTTGFGSVCLGSNPGRTTQKKSALLMLTLFCVYIK